MKFPYSKEDEEEAAFDAVLDEACGITRKTVVTESTGDSGDGKSSLSIFEVLQKENPFVLPFSAGTTGASFPVQAATDPTAFLRNDHDKKRKASLGQTTVTIQNPSSDEDDNRTVPPAANGDEEYEEDYKILSTVSPFKVFEYKGCRIARIYDPLGKGSTSFIMLDVPQMVLLIWNQVDIWIKRKSSKEGDHKALVVQSGTVWQETKKTDKPKRWRILTSLETKCKDRFKGLVVIDESTINSDEPTIEFIRYGPPTNSWLSRQHKQVDDTSEIYWDVRSVSSIELLY